MSEKTGRLRSRLCSFNTLPSRYGNGADFHHGLLARPSTGGVVRREIPDSDRGLVRKSHAWPETQ